jgi:hypothetical protein
MLVQMRSLDNQSKNKILIHLVMMQTELLNFIEDPENKLNDFAQTKRLARS